MGGFLIGGVGLRTITFTFMLVAFGGTGNFSSGITLCCNINLFCQCLAPSGVVTTYDLGVFSSDVDITETACHRLTMGNFCSHTGCWGKSDGSMGIIPNIFLSLE